MVEEKSIKLWDLPTRVFHWLLVGSFAIAWYAGENEIIAFKEGFFDVTEKIALVIGMVTFGFLNSIISIQSSVLALAIFFLAAFIVISQIKKTKYVR